MATKGHTAIQILPRLAHVCVYARACLQPSRTCNETHSSQCAPATGSWKEFEHERSTLQVRTSHGFANQVARIKQTKSMKSFCPLNRRAKFLNYDHSGPCPCLSHSSLSPTMQLMHAVNINCNRMPTFTRSA